MVSDKTVFCFMPLTHHSESVLMRKLSPCHIYLATNNEYICIFKTLSKSFDFFLWQEITHLLQALTILPFFSQHHPTCLIAPFFKHSTHISSICPFAPFFSHPPTPPSPPKKTSPSSKPSYGVLKKGQSYLLTIMV